MALTERVEQDQVIVQGDGQMSVRFATIVERDGVEIARNFHRVPLCPSGDLTAARELGGLAERIAVAIFDEDTIAAFLAARS